MMLLLLLLSFWGQLVLSTPSSSPSLWMALVKNEHRLQKPESLLKVKITHHFKSSLPHLVNINHLNDWDEYIENEGTYDDSYLKVYQFEGNQKDVIYSIYGDKVDHFDTNILYVERNMAVKKQGGEGLESSFTEKRWVQGSHGLQESTESNQQLPPIINKDSSCRISPNTGSNNGYKPGYFSWGLDIIDSRNPVMDLHYCPANGRTGNGVRVFILDTGFVNPLPSHIPSNRVIREFDAYPNGDFCSDKDGHGTHTGSLIISDEYGGAPGAKLHIYKVLNDQGGGTLADILNALVQILISPHNDGVISMSLGLYLDSTKTPSFAINDVLYQLMNTKNFIVLAAAGNDGRDACYNYPSNVPGVISVGAIGINRVKAGFSNYGSCVTVFAPGVNVVSSGLIKESAAHYSGTSQATPIASSVIALYKQQYGISEPAKNVIDKFLNFTTVNTIYGLDSHSPNKLVYIGSFGHHINPPTNPNNSTIIYSTFVILILPLFIFFF